MFVETKTYLDRLKICNKCELYNNMKCSVCGCYMVLKTMLQKDDKGNQVECPHPDGPKWLAYEKIKRKDTSSAGN